MKNLEIEYKVMVSKDDFELLLEKLSNLSHRLFIQTNYYYDTSNADLKKSGLSLRIRHIENENKYLLTLKENQIEGKLEYEEYLPNNDINNIPIYIDNILNRYNIDKSTLINKAKLTTIRKEFVIENSNLCLDYNSYYNKEDYEIECESTSMNKAKKIVVGLLDKYNISYKESKESKVARAIKNKEMDV